LSKQKNSALSHTGIGLLVGISGGYLLATFLSQFQLP